MSPTPTMLIVDDDPSNLSSYSMFFGRKAYRLLTADGGARGVDILREETVDVVITDLKMPEVDGLEVVRAASNCPQPPVVIVITAYGTVESAVEAMRLGAFDYITKPVNPTELQVKVDKAFEMRALRVRNEELEGLIHERFRFEGVIGESREMRTVIEQARLVANSRASALILGESGTGKELVARAIHFNSPRAAGPFVPIHCAALPETLIESELFGSEKGAYTGAHARRIGQFESAEGGTVFLDELAEIPPGTQVKLLRVLEQREITRVGATQPTPIDIRLVTATNKDLAKEVKEGRFREDLYYRLNVVHIEIPPLRQRREDIAPLADHFLKMVVKENNRSPLSMDKAVLNALVQAPWPGNIRELRNAIEQMVVFAKGSEIGLDNLPVNLRAGQEQAGADAHEAGAYDAGRRTDLTLDEVEKRHIVDVLDSMNQNRTRAAEKLGISRRTLQRKLKELGMAEPGATK